MIYDLQSHHNIHRKSLPRPRRTISGARSYLAVSWCFQSNSCSTACVRSSQIICSITSEKRIPVVLDSVENHVVTNHGI